MQTELERPSQFRVLMRIPRLRHHLPETPAVPPSLPKMETLTPKLEFEVTEVARQVAEDIATVHRGRRWMRPSVLVPVLVVTIAVAMALLSRHRGTPAPEPAHDVPLGIPMVTLPTESTATPSLTPIPGGSPAEITSAPELALPSAPGMTGDPMSMIERLPPAPLESAVLPPQSDLPYTQSTPPSNQSADGMALLEKRIVTPKPDAHYDSSRPGLY